MSLFVHAKLGHFLMDEAQEDGGEGGLLEVPEQEEPEEEAAEPEEQAEPEEEEGELLLSLGEQPKAEEPEQDEKTAPKWVKELRQSQRDLAKENRELKKQLQQNQAKEKPKAPTVGKKPALSDPDIDYDEEKYEARYSEWSAQVRKAEEFEAEQKKGEEQAQQAWQSRLDAYNEQKNKLAARVPDYEDSAESMMGVFSQEQQAMIIDVADNAAQMVYVLGRNPEEAKKLADIKSPTKFIRELARLEDTKLKVAKKDKPAPEKSVTGAAPKSGAVDSQLERLREKAMKTGDYTEVNAYKRKMKAQA